jgi:hypothetical protein
MILPPCPICGGQADGSAFLRIIEVDHVQPCPFVDSQFKTKMLLKYVFDRWEALTKVIAAGLRATGADVHENYKQWEQENV